MISASRQEMLLAGEAPQDSVQLSGNRGYLASLGVFHELHCLVKAPLGRYFCLLICSASNSLLPLQGSLLSQHNGGAARVRSKAYRSVKRDGCPTTAKKYDRSLPRDSAPFVHVQSGHWAIYVSMDTRSHQARHKIKLGQKLCELG